MRTPLIIANWKMHGTQAGLVELATAIAADAAGCVDVAVLPPFVYIPAIAAALQGKAVAVGAQTVADHIEDGAFTGEVSARMLVEVGCRYVAVGHSERREYYGATDELVAQQFMAAKQAGLIPILCVGESLAEREAGQTDAVVKRQLAAVLAVSDFADAVLAYEPVWAIGTGKTATPEQAQAVHAMLRQTLAESNANIAQKTRILYGGSMKPANAAELLTMTDIDGGLVGGASLKANDFLAIIAAAGDKEV